MEGVDDKSALLSVGEQELDHSARDSHTGLVPIRPNAVTKELDGNAVFDVFAQEGYRRIVGYFANKGFRDAEDLTQEVYTKLWEFYAQAVLVVEVVTKCTNPPQGKTTTLNELIAEIDTTESAFDITGRGIFTSVSNLAQGSSEEAEDAGLGEAYANDWRNFQEWCQQKPADRPCDRPDTIAAYLMVCRGDETERGRKLQAISRNFGQQDRDALYQQVVDLYRRRKTRAFVRRCVASGWLAWGGDGSDEECVSLGEVPIASFEPLQRQLFSVRDRARTDEIRKIKGRWTGDNGSNTDESTLKSVAEGSSERRAVDLIDGQQPDNAENPRPRVVSISLEQMIEEQGDSRMFSDSGSDPQRHVIEASLRDRVEHVLSELEDRERTCVMAYFYSDCPDKATYKAVSNDLNLTVEQVKYALRTAKGKIREWHPELAGWFNDR